MSSYACHPQVASGRQVISNETVGVALDRFEKTNSSVFPIYFTGCAGDVTAGKYTTTNLEENIRVFGGRLYDAMQAAFDKAVCTELPRLDWSNCVFELPIRQIDENEEELIAQIQNPNIRSPYKYPAAMKLGQLGPNRQTYPFRMTHLQLAHIGALFLPAELCVEYQAHAKRCSGGPLLVVAYGDCHLAYVATDEAFDQGGFEVSPDWTRIEKGVEPIIKRQVTRFLSSAR